MRVAEIVGVKSLGQDPQSVDIALWPAIFALMMKQQWSMTCVVGNHSQGMTEDREYMWR